VVQFALADEEIFVMALYPRGFKDDRTQAFGFGFLSF